MARRRPARGRGPRGGGGRSGGLDAKDVMALADSFKNLAGEAAGLAKSFVMGADEVKRGLGGLSSIISSTALTDLRETASGFGLSTMARNIESFREGAGALSAEAAARRRVESIAAKAAGVGMPIENDGDIADIYKDILAQEQAMEKARQSVPNALKEFHPTPAKSVWSAFWQDSATPQSIYDWLRINGKPESGGAASGSGADMMGNSIGRDVADGFIEHMKRSQENLMKWWR